MRTAHCENPIETIFARKKNDGIAAGADGSRVDWPGHPARCKGPDGPWSPSDGQEIYSR